MGLWGITNQRSQQEIKEKCILAIKGRRHIKVLFGELPNAGDPLVLFAPCDEVGESHM